MILLAFTLRLHAGTLEMKSVTIWIRFQSESEAAAVEFAEPKVPGTSVLREPPSEWALRPAIDQVDFYGRQILPLRLRVEQPASD